MKVEASTCSLCIKLELAHLSHPAWLPGGLYYMLLFLLFIFDPLSHQLSQNVLDRSLSNFKDF